MHNTFKKVFIQTNNKYIKEIRSAKNKQKKTMKTNLQFTALYYQTGVFFMTEIHYIYEIMQTIFIIFF